MDLRESIRSRPMRRLQIITVAICLALCMVDGFEILVAAFVAPHIARAWQLSQVQVGYLLGSGVFGMTLGALLISPLADRIGRRRHIILCLVFITLGMALSATATSLDRLIAYRAMSGLFIGAVISSLNITVSEYSSDRRHGAVMGLYGIGLPAGAALGGLASSVLIARYGWTAPFVLGALLSGSMLLLVIAALPESIDYLVERQPAGALVQYNRIARLLGQPVSDRLPAPKPRGSQRGAWRVIFAGTMRMRTAYLWGMASLLASGFYFANTWTAKLIADATGDPALGVRAGVMVLSGGIVGALVFAGLALLMQPRVAAAWVIAGAAAAFAIYANAFGSVGTPWALLLAFIVGVFVNGGIAASYAISPSVYPAAVRATAVGWMIGVARCVSIATPIGCGYLLTAGWKPATLFQFFAGVLLVAAIACLLLDRTYGEAVRPEGELQ